MSLKDNVQSFATSKLVAIIVTALASSFGTFLAVAQPAVYRALCGA